MNRRDLETLASETRDAYIKASEEFETRIKSYGVAGGHEWMFAVREALYDLSRLDASLCKLYSASDRDAAVKLMREYAELWLYQVLPHVQAHMSELETEIDRVLTDVKPTARP